ncbi:MAG: hypothetical protein JSR48_05420 [Verrucomicrobia bacterium]|nr:hypothetical protein [Verrucomicrobiota bacterium]
MNLPHSHFQPPPVREVPAMIRFLKREDVQWDRPVFRAPPLVVKLPAPEELLDLQPSPLPAWSR